MIRCDWGGDNQLIAAEAKGSAERGKDRANQPVIFARPKARCESTFPGKVAPMPWAEHPACCMA